MTRASRYADRRRHRRKRVVWRRPRLKQSDEPVIGPLMFWGTVVLCVLLNLVPEGRLIATPFRLLMIWAHEIFHLLAAIFVGGDVVSFIITPNFGGIAVSHKSGDVAGAIGAGAGLLGPSVVAGVMIIMIRGLQESSLALFLLAGALISSGFFWGGDLFTQATTISFGVISILLALIGHPRLRSGVALIVAIFFATNGILALDYAFVTGGTVNGRTLPSDTAQVAAYVGGSPAMWGLVISFVAVLILYLAYSVSNPTGRR